MSDKINYNVIWHELHVSRIYSDILISKIKKQGVVSFMFAKKNERGMSSKYAEQMKKGLNPKTKKREMIEAKKKIHPIVVIGNILNSVFTAIIFIIIFALLAYVFCVIIGNTDGATGTSSVNDFIGSLRNLF